MTTNQKIVTLVLVIVLGCLLALHNPFGGYEKSKVLYSKAEFMRKFREIWPEYNDVKDEKLYKAIIKKDPEILTWIEGENKNGKVLPMLRKDKPTNFIMKPPPAYYGISPIIKSRKAFVHWLDEPVEFIGIVVPMIIVGLVGILLLRKKR